MPLTHSICGLSHPVLALILMPVCAASAGCERSAFLPESGLFDSANSSLSAGAVNALNGTYGTDCIERSGSWTVRVGNYAGALENPALSVVDSNSACLLSLDSVDSGNNRFLPVSPISLSGSFAASALAFKQEGDAAIAFYANSNYPTPLSLPCRRFRCLCRVSPHAPRPAQYRPCLQMS